MSAYYNEFDPYAAQWLRNLIDAGQIAPGDVDSRSIKDVSADDLRGYTQCHFFAGIGVWSHALRSSAWPDHRPVWTGSCPCQPFSVAGKGEGQADDRHLWPVWFKLIEQCRPPVVFGEQVEAAIRHGWLDLVQGDLENIGYASAAVCIPAGSVGAPHIRQRLWFVAHHHHQRLEGHGGYVSHWEEPGWHGTQSAGSTGPGCGPGELADPLRDGAKHRPGESLGAEAAVDRRDGSVSGERLWTGEQGAVGELADTATQRRQHEQAITGSDGALAGAGQSRIRTSGGGDSFELADAELWPAKSGGQLLGRTPGETESAAQERQRLWNESGAGRDSFGQPGASPTDHFWRDADWLLCRDGKWRPTQSIHEPLADGVADELGFVCSKTGGYFLSPLIEKGFSRVGRLRAYGNAIVPQVASEVIKAFMEFRP